MESRGNISSRFAAYRVPEGHQRQVETLREAYTGLAQVINSSCPESREKALALTALEDSFSRTVRAIARGHGDPVVVFDNDGPLAADLRAETTIP